MTKEEIYVQNICDLGYIIQKLAVIIDNHQLSNDEIKDLCYCKKVIKQVNEKMKIKISN